MANAQNRTQARPNLEYGISLPHMVVGRLRENEEAEETSSPTTDENLVNTLSARELSDEEDLELPFVPMEAGMGIVNLQIKMKILVSGLIQSKEFDLLRLVMFPQEVQYEKFPLLYLKPIREHLCRDWGYNRLDVYATTLLMMKNGLKEITANKKLKVIFDGYKVAFPTLLQGELKEASTNEDLRRVFYAVLLSKELREAALKNLKGSNAEKHYWVEEKTNGQETAGTSVGKKSSEVALEAYFTRYYDAFIAWQRMVFEQFFDDSKSFQENKTTCEAIIDLNSFIVERHIAQVDKDLTIWLMNNNRQREEIERLENRLKAIIQTYGLNYLPETPIGMFEVIDENDNTPLHLLLKHIATERKNDKTKPFSVAIKKLIKFLPNYIDSLRSSLEDPRTISFKAILAMKNKEGVTIEVLLKECGEDVGALLREQWAVGKEIGKFTGKRVIEPIAAPKSTLAKVAHQKIVEWPVSPEHNSYAAPMDPFRSSGALELPGRLVPIAGDGNCFFNALARELERSNLGLFTPAEVRTRGIAYLQAHPEILQAHPPEAETVEQYLTRMSQNGVWAEGAIIEAIAKEFNVHLAIVEIRQNREIRIFHLNDQEEQRNTITLALKAFLHYDVLEVDEPVLTTSSPVSPVSEAAASPEKDVSGSKAEASPEAFASPLKEKTDLIVTEDTNDSPYQKMMSEVTTLPWNVRAPDLTLLPPYNTDEKRTRLAFHAVDVSSTFYGHSKSNLLVRYLLSLKKDALIETSDTEAVKEAVRKLTALDEILPDEDAISLDTAGSLKGISNPARAIYGIHVEVEYTEYLLHLWREDLALGYLELMYAHIRQAEKAGELNTLEDLLIIRENILEDLTEHAFRSFLQLDGERRGLWTDYKGGQNYYEGTIKPILRSYVDAFKLWEQESQFRLVNENKNLDILKAGIRDLADMIVLYQASLAGIEGIHSKRVEAFYEEIRRLLAGILSEYPQLFAIDTSVVPDEIAELFKIDPKNPASVMRFSHIFTHEIGFDSVDDYGNTLLHRAYLRRSNTVSDWIVREVMPSRIDSNCVHPILMKKNMFGQKAYEIPMLFPNSRDLDILQKALLATEKARERQAGAGARPASPLLGFSKEEAQLIELIQFVMDRVPGLYHFLRSLEDFLNLYNENDIFKEAEELKKYREKDVWVSLKWRAAYLFLGQDKVKCLWHRQMAMFELNEFRQWITNAVRKLGTKELTSAQELSNEFIDKILEEARKVARILVRIVNDKDITDEKFKSNLLMKVEDLKAVIASWEMKTRADNLAKQKSASLIDENGMPLMPTEIAFSSPREFVLYQEREAYRRGYEEAKSWVKREREAREKAEKESAKANAKSEASEAEATKAKERVAKAEERVAKAEEEATKVKEQAAKAEEQAAKAEEQAAEAKAEANKLKEQAAKAAERATATEVEINKLKEQMVALMSRLDGPHAGVTASSADIGRSINSSQVTSVFAPNITDAPARDDGEVGTKAEKDMKFDSLS